MTKIRQELVSYLVQELVGPEAEREVLDSSPCQRYSAGVLFPAGQQCSPLDDLSEASEDLTDQEPEEVPFDPDLEDGRLDRESRKAQESDGHDEIVLLANSYLPSAIGLTFLVDRDAAGLAIDASAAVYSSRPASRGRGSEWVREPLELPEARFQLDYDESSHGSEVDLHRGQLTLRVVSWRRRDGNHLVTVSLFNRSENSRNPPRPGDCYFQAGFTVMSEGASFLALPDSPRSRTDPEEISLDMLYWKRRTFARGHGCAATWEASDDDRTGSVSTETIPCVRVPAVEPRSDNEKFMSMEFLGGAGLSAAVREIPDALEGFAGAYSEWIEKLDPAAVLKRFEERAAKHISDCRETLARIENGIDLLRRDPQCLEAFMLANQAMLMQQYHHGRTRRKPNSDFFEPVPEEYISRRGSDRVVGYWRNFQLAFILMNLSAFTGDHAEKYRDVVDLIWFPTGGGKTEAYLGLAAYTIFLRRLRDPRNGGVTVLMRYTLRLLTAQQFQRASSLICACEQIRTTMPERLGEERISIGLWVGSSLTPNSRQDALASLTKLEKDDPFQENPFQLLTCPWCGAALDKKPLGYRRDSSQGHRTVQFRCPENECSFSHSRRPLPVVVIDEDIYSNPPTLVIGTVDKFAMLAWKPATSRLFGVPGSQPPDLIIQDELHLITGPLGSMVGLYESVIDLLCTRRGRAPKLVASTATIRRAGEQCKALYCREAVQFPPPGLDVADSWFAQEDDESPGRMYLGVLPTAAPSPVTSLVRAAAALLQGTRDIPLGDGQKEALRDPYWTLVQYFGSIRELGRASTLVEADIPEYIKVITKRRDALGSRMRWVGYPVELTSRRTASEIPRILERLEVPYGSESSGRPLDTLLATNMISVGVDIDRLGLMLVVGQPKATSEYIQATSRVGRSRSAPGLVVTLFNAGKPRDRSHYEQFTTFHESFYRHVEPSSVTPFSLPVVDRALHAILVIAARHVQGAQEPTDFDPDSREMRDFRVLLERRVKAIDPEHAGYLLDRLDTLSRHWKRSPPGSWGGFGVVPEERPLMYPAGSEPRAGWDGQSWATPTSMRNVDAECGALVLQVYPEKDGVQA